jgi:HAD superfamily hydrolase (TIGR01509 family)
MIVLIPLGGKGLRFRNKNIMIPKALVHVENKPIIYWLLDNDYFENPAIEYIYIPYHRDYISHDFESILNNRYPKLNFKFLPLPEDTKGAAHTVNIALMHLKESSEMDKPVICIDADNFYKTDIISTWNGRNMIFTFTDYNDDCIFSYLSTDENNVIQCICEKQYVSDQRLACTGAYGFSSYLELLEHSKNVLENTTNQKECYISMVVQNMLDNKICIHNHTISNKDYFSLGTPEQIDEFNYVYLIDLDGTLVNTDSVYEKVWETLLKPYGICVNHEFFETKIKGKSDVSFLEDLLPDISVEEISIISKSKDDLFIQHINMVQLYEGALEFLQKLQNNRIAIVTNSNNLAAATIIKQFNIHEYINIIIASDDCKKHKPSAEPYLIAIDKLDCHFAYKNDKCIVIEDSITGYMSAKNAKIKNILFKINDNNLNYKTIKCKTFYKYEQLDKMTLLSHDNYINVIKTFINAPIHKIVSDNSLKTNGYICSIYSYKIYTTNDSTKDVILKVSNNDNSLGQTASKLNLYNNEKIFYEKIANHLHDIIDCPKCYGVHVNDKKVIIVMDDLCQYGGQFNVNLNNNIDVLLNVIHKISRLHTKFYYEKDDNLINLNEVLKINEYIYHDFIKNRYDVFKEKSAKFIKKNTLQVFDSIYQCFDKVVNHLSTYPLSLCHGDLKSPNIFYANNMNPYFLDWQYINLSKGVTDVIFLLVESVEFNEIICDIAIKYYYTLISSYDAFYEYQQYMYDLKMALCCFPFFVCVWFNSEDSSVLNDKLFPLRFMKNYMKYLEYLIDDEFIKSLVV